MNDYKELIAKCDYWINLGDEIDKKLAITKFMEECRDAIEQLVGDYAILAKMYAKVNEDLCIRTKERDAAVADLAVFSDASIVTQVPYAKIVILIMTNGNGEECRRITMRLIEVDEVHNLVKNSKKYMWSSPISTDRKVTVSTDDIQFGVDKIPTVDAEPVRHGHWIEDEPVKNYPQFVNDKLVAAPARSFHCSRCQTVAYNMMRNFCSYCGAKMDEEGGAK